MTTTTIKVPSELRDRLKSAARRDGRSMSEYIDRLLSDEEFRSRMARLREEIALTPPDDEYLADAEVWQNDSWLR
ncbi:MAG TPA: Arc family DNA-binding protein [Arachnia sp.]|nr:Arc family DNA-binding protein [Arachnia sp.]HMT86827.1 Arc family DNA-binding protein [Arachnia sp.]